VKKLFGPIGLSLLAVAGLVLIRTLAFTAEPVPSVERMDVEVDEATVTAHMVDAIRFKTISVAVEQIPDYAPFADFVAWLKATYPEVQESLALEMVADYTMLYKWKGRNVDLKPILLTAHYDVVPVVPGSEGDWKHPPFAAEISDEHVWGRGAMDDKSAVVVMLEATTMLLKEGFQPERTIYFSYSHDEERGGPLGAAGVTALLKERGVQLAWSLDEGSFIVKDILPGSDKPIAMINVAEKGGVTLDLIARGVGGHSSMPAPETAVDILAKALVNLRKHPVPGGLDGLSGELFDEFARNGSFAYRMLFANKWLFGGLIERQLSANGAMDAMIRTTTAPTILKAGIKTNVIPPTALASVNFRVHPRDTPEGVRDHVIAAIDDDRVTVTMQDAHQHMASEVSSTDSEGYRMIGRVARQFFGDLVVVPGLTVGGTDSKHYGKVADDSYRFQYMLVGRDDISGFHGTNERVSIDNLVKGTGAYYLLMKEAAGK
jgi:carboxypeptidase PM20D1